MRYHHQYDIEDFQPLFSELSLHLINDLDRYPKALSGISGQTTQVVYQLGELPKFQDNPEELSEIFLSLSARCLRYAQVWKKRAEQIEAGGQALPLGATGQAEVERIFD